jgi:hypothetical protein
MYVSFIDYLSSPPVFLAGFVLLIVLVLCVVLLYVSLRSEFRVVKSVTIFP